MTLPENFIHGCKKIHEVFDTYSGRMIHSLIATHRVLPSFRSLKVKGIYFAKVFLRIQDAALTCRMIHMELSGT